MIFVCGVLTTASGVLFLFLMPASLETAWFLPPEESLLVTGWHRNTMAETKPTFRWSSSKKQLSTSSPMLHLHLVFWSLHHHQV